jgi:hypothetical protein
MQAALVRFSIVFLFHFWTERRDIQATGTFSIAFLTNAGNPEQSGIPISIRIFLGTPLANPFVHLEFPFWATNSQHRQQTLPRSSG